MLDVFGPDALGGAYSPVHMPFLEPEYQSRVVEYLIFTVFRKVNACCAKALLLKLRAAIYFAPVVVMVNAIRHARPQYLRGQGLLCRRCWQVKRFLQQG